MLRMSNGIQFLSHEFYSADSSNEDIKYNNPVRVQDPKIHFMFETRFVFKIPFVIIAKNVCIANVERVCVCVFVCVCLPGR